MNCRTCGYALWNLRERTCPECGAPFRPSEFKFLQNTVQFCCPHCAQDYYGTGEEGHLVPRSFNCVRCRARIDMDEMVLLPTAGVREERTRALEMPWLEPGATAGWWGKRWFKTVLSALGTPGQLMEAMPREERPRAALRFAYLGYLVNLVIGGGPVLLIMVPAFLFGGGWSAVVTFLGVMLAFALLPLILILGWAGLAHAILRLTGETELGYGRTVEAIAYSSATNLLAAIPCLGTYVAPAAWVWWVISGTIMVRKGQGVSGKRAAAAVITPAAVVFAASVALMALLVVPAISSAMQAAAAAAAQAGTLTEIRSRDMLAELREEAALRGTWPHIAELVADGSVPAMYLRTDGKLMTEVSIAGVRLDDLATMRPEQRDAAVAAIRAGIPPGVAAYRLADYIFVYPGLPAQDASGDLWVFMAQDRMQPVAFGEPPPPPGNVAFVVGKADGSVLRLTEEEFAAALIEQNRLRRSEGLSELPHPEKVDRFWPEE